MKLGIMCSSRENANIDLKRNNSKIANTISKRDYIYVMGANSFGSMGEIKEIIRENKKKLLIVGNQIELEMNMADIKVPVRSTFERTAKIYENSDVILFLNGGVGTVSEFYAFLENKLETQDNKTLIIYNGNGNFNYLLEDLEKRKEEGLLDNNYNLYFDIANNLEELVASLEKAENKLMQKGEKEYNGKDYNGKIS